MRNYYVYVYLDTSKNGVYSFDDIYLHYEPFYVGKGRNERFLAHLKKNPANKILAEKIKEIRQKGFEPCVIKIAENIPTDGKALEIEDMVIEKIGRKDLGIGTLLNKNKGRIPFNQKIIVKIINEVNI